MIIIKHFAEKIKKARKEAGISQEKAAELLKTSQSNISKYENGVFISEILIFISSFENP